ncbi:hypothetical protein RRG08_008782 [Elysia crispata]|uniref:Uncharacterized protein n=1 Tax=Elysia crispata TaxID=231223 RepID=A0AAE0Z7T2_9GAST|nr:hypothetical protein RRG08_008782 [Elysia crispata]
MPHRPRPTRPRSLTPSREDLEGAEGSAEVRPARPEPGGHAVINTVHKRNSEFNTGGKVTNCMMSLSISNYSKIGIEDLWVAGSTLPRPIRSGGTYVQVAINCKSRISRSRTKHNAGYRIPLRMPLNCNSRPEAVEETRGG